MATNDWGKRGKGIVLVSCSCIVCPGTLYTDMYARIVLSHFIVVYSPASLTPVEHLYGLVDGDVY